MRILLNIFLVFVSLIWCSLSCKPKKKVVYNLSIVSAEPIIGNLIPKDVSLLCLPFEYGDSLIVHSNREAISPMLKRIDGKTNQLLYVDASNWFSSFFGAGTKKLKSNIERGLESMDLNPEFGQANQKESVKTSLDSLISAVKRGDGFALIYAKNSPVPSYNDIRVLPTIDSVRSVLEEALVKQKVKNVTIIYDVAADLLSESAAEGFPRDSTQTPIDSTLGIDWAQYTQDSITIDNGRNNTCKENFNMVLNNLKISYSLYLQEQSESIRKDIQQYQRLLSNIKTKCN